VSRASGVSADGSIVVGASCDVPGAYCQAYLWDGTIHGLGIPDGDFTGSYATAISANGKTIVGFNYASATAQAFRWTQETGMKSIEELLTAAGVAFTGWQLNFASGVSADGSVIVGIGTDPNGQRQGWIARFQGQPSTLSWSSTGTSCTGTGFSTNGTNSGSITVTPSQTTTYSLSCTGANGSASNSATITVTPPPPPPGSYSIFTTQTPAGEFTDGAGVNYELGTSFTSSVAGSITAIRFYKTANDTGTHTGHVWSSSGTQLASVTFSGETASGWQQQNLSSPLEIAANTVYTVSVNTGNTYYASTNRGLASAITNGPLTTIVGQNGLFGSPGAYPRQTWQKSNYFRDVVLNTSGGGSTSNPPTATLTANPTSGSPSTLTWSSSNATSCTGTNFTANGTSGSASVSLTQTTTYSITCTGTGGSASASATVTVNANQQPDITGTFFSDDFNGTALSSDWTVISRHGEYSQNETECNLPSAVTLANGTLTITTSAQAATCGDFYPDGTVWHTPQSWPYTTGAVQWTSKNFTYGTIEVRARVPNKNTSTWPAIWLLGANCQQTNPLTGETGVGNCPNIGTSGSNPYVEADLVECYSSGWCQFHVANPSFSSGVAGCDVSWPVQPDNNFHVFKTVWDQTGFKQYMDGTLETTCNNPITKPMFLIMQTQTGGVSGTPSNANLPTTFDFDWVRVDASNGGATAPTATLTANPTSITSGQSSTLAWSSTNATSCTGTGFTANGTSGSVSVSPTQTTTYSVSCTGAGGSVSAQTTITVGSTPPPPGNIAQSGTAYYWHSNSSATSNNSKVASPALNDGNLTTDVSLDGGTAESSALYEGAGVIWPSAQTISSADFVNGTWIQSTGDGGFSSKLQLQFTTDGTTWNNSSWTLSPAYPYDSASASGQTYTFSGPAATVLGFRVIGQVHTTTNSSYWANVREVRAY
jgi:hypothetical protein